MTPRGRAVLLPAAAASILAASASAHHSVAAEFDRSARLELVGVITELEWVYPHTFFRLDTVDANGTAGSWRLESLPTAMFRKYGLSRQKLIDGETVTVEAIRARDPHKHLAWILSIEYPDGRCFRLDGG